MGVADTTHAVWTSVLTVNVVVTVAGSAALGLAMSVRQARDVTMTEGFSPRDISMSILLFRMEIEVLDSFVKRKIVDLSDESQLAANRDG
jgi:hypothetical protein